MDYSEFLNREIREGFINGADFLYGDNVLAIEANENLRELNIFSHSLFLFSIIEGLAGLYSGENSRMQCSADDVSLFLQKYFSQYYDKFNDLEFCKFFLEHLEMD